MHQGDGRAARIGSGAMVVIAGPVGTRPLCRSGRGAGGAGHNSNDAALDGDGGQ